MVICEWTEKNGWAEPELIPYGPISLDPATAVFHYGQEIFEGMKAYRQPDGGIALFRPEANARRFAKSAARLALPEMPEALFFTDKDGTKRTEIRIKWWEDPFEMTYKSISVEPIENLPEQPIELSELNSLDFYRNHDKKVFFGHYWLKGEPTFYKENICCLDYSVAKGGKLVAYRLNEETILDKENLIYV
jgi:hypothetical protein